MPGMKPVRFDVHTVFTAWDWSPFAICVAVGVLVAGYLYLRGDWRLAARGRRWRGRRTISFFAGLLAVDLALQSPVSTFTNSYFQAHIRRCYCRLAPTGPSAPGEKCSTRGRSPG
jgi:cytochrome c oxidase assembly factor CtaG